MQVLLRKDVDKLGKCGDVVKVKTGYARNYLLPQQIAAEVTSENVRLLETEKKKKVEQEKAHFSTMEELAEKLNSMSVTISAKADGDHLFGSVGPNEIAAALKDEGIPLEKAQIRMEQHIKEVGDYKVSVHLYQDIEAMLRVWVISE